MVGHYLDKGYSYLVLISTLLFFNIQADPLAVSAQLQPTKKEIVQAVFNQVDSQKSDSILRSHEWQELEIDLMLQKIDRTKTGFGAWGLTSLTQPVHDINQIMHRQTRIKKIVDDPLLRLNLVKVLQEIKIAEDDILSYWDIKDELARNAGSLYYSLLGEVSSIADNYLNRNRIALEGAAFFDIGYAIFNVAQKFGISGMMNEFLVAAAEGREMDLWQGLKNGLQLPLQVNTPYPDVFKNGYKKQLLPRAWSQGTAGDYYTFFQNEAKTPAVVSGLLTVGFVAAYDAYIAYDINNTRKRLVDLYKIGYALQARMARIASFFKAVDKLCELLIPYEDIFGKKLVQELNLHLYSKKARELVDVLKTATFNGPAGYFYFRGRVLYANQLMDDVKQELIPLLQAIAHVDGYYSIAQIFNDQSAHAPYSFAQFIDGQGPVLILDDFWTPLIPTKTPVLNSINWTNHTRTKTLITGPNGAGKSTVMKSVAHAIIMAQAWGIVPAKKGSIKIFNGLRSSLSPREDLQQNLSTFMAEKTRIDDIRACILDTKPDQSIFVVLDEPFRGTVESEASYRVCLLGKEIAPIEQCMLVIASHLEGPIILEKETGFFANYQLKLDETADGKFIRTFKLIPGAALWWFHDVDKRRRFVDQLLSK